MAIFDASNSDDVFEMFDLSLVTVGSYTSQTATVLQYLATDGTTLVTLTGSFTYAGGLPASGTVSQIEFDSSNDGDTDITITYGMSEYPDVLDLIASGDAFWRAALAGADTFTPAENGAPGFVQRYYYTDYLNTSFGEVIVAKDDVLTYGGGGGSFQYYADVGTNNADFTGGNDTVDFVATQATGGIYLDAITNSATGVLVGGDDIVTSSAPAGISSSSSIQIYGDVNSNFGTLTGGNDTIYVRYAANATIYGDANLLVTGTLIGGNDTITGTIAGVDTLFGDVSIISAGTTFTGGDDIIDGNAGDDIIYGDYQTNEGGTIISGGNDILNGGGGNDSIYGNEGDDVIDGAENDDIMDGGAGNDTATYLASFAGVFVSLALQGGQQDTLGAGLDTLSNFENLTGSRLDDTLKGDANDNVIDGGASTGAGFGDDVMDGAGGIDTVSFASAESAVSVTLSIQFGVQQDTLGGGLDTLTDFENLTGSDFDDILEGDINDNAIDGGIGNDTATYGSSASGVSVSLALQGAQQNTIGAGLDTLTNFENLTGSALNDRLAGDTSNNVIDGGAGAGNDVLDGGGGIDTVSYASAESAVRVALSIQSGVQQNTLGAGLDTLSNFENLIGSDFDDLLAGDSTDNAIDGGAGTDTVTYEFAASGADIYLTWGNVSGGGGNDSLTSIESVIGSSFDDRLIGSAGVNTLSGGDGNDIIKSKGGDDVMNGGAGDDRITGGAGIDTVNGGTGVDTVTGSSGNDILNGDAGDDYLYGNGDNDTLSGGADDDKLTGGKGNDTLYGGDGVDRNFGGKGDDIIYGDAGNDYLYGENGIDTLYGGAGDDSLTGGISMDIFVFAQGGGYDRIKDWEDGTDLINLTSFNFSGIADVLAIAVDYSGGVRLEFNDGSLLLIEGETSAILSAGDFIF